MCTLESWPPLAAALEEGVSIEVFYILRCFSA